MTESEWRESTDSMRMLDHLVEYNASQRKLRLVACARGRQCWHLLTDDRSRTAVEVGERYADGDAKIAELRAAADGAWAAAETGRRPSAWVAVGAGCEDDPTGNSFWDVAWDFYRVSDPAEAAALDAAGKNEVTLIRDIFGNPFRPVTVEGGWLTPTVLGLARGIYDEGAFDRLPILADALEDAGCTETAFLSHLRGEGPHVRGCWVLDALLEKS